VRIKRRITLIVEKREVSVLMGELPFKPGFCRRCGHEVSMLPAGLAASCARVTERVIYQWVEAGRVHFEERPDGTILICLDSLTPS
jgi:hypothetical protein